MSELDLTVEQWLDALKRMRSRIAEGLEFVAEDCDDIGNKSTFCSWGMCSDGADQWPEDMRLFPERDSDRSRVSSKYRPRGFRCPMSRLGPLKKEGEFGGCFHKCSVFNPERVTKKVRGRKRRVYKDRPTREETLRRYDEAIKIVSGLLAETKQGDF